VAGRGRARQGLAGEAWQGGARRGEAGMAGGVWSGVVRWGPVGPGWGCQVRSGHGMGRGEPPLFAVAGIAGAGRTSKEWMTFIFCRTRQAPRNT